MVVIHRILTFFIILCKEWLIFVCLCHSISLYCQFRTIATSTAYNGDNEESNRIYVNKNNDEESNRINVNNNDDYDFKHDFRNYFYIMIHTFFLLAISLIHQSIIPMPLVNYNVKSIHLLH